MQMPKDLLSIARKNQSRNISLLFGVFFPSVWFLLLMGLFTYKYHTAPVAPWFATLIGLNIVLLSSWPFTVAPRRWTRWDWFPMFAGLSAVGLGTSLGIPNSAVLEPWVHATHLREHTDVLPSWDPRLAADAGIIRFADGVVPDTDSAVGFRVWPHTYCAAPIVDNTTDNGEPLGFFAVGIDCCDSRGKFTCEGAQDPRARGGVRVNSHPVSHFSTWDVGDGYLRAARMAAARCGREVKEQMAFVLWTKDPQSLANDAWWTATGIFIGSMVLTIALGVGSAIMLLKHHEKQDQKQN